MKDILLFIVDLTAFQTELSNKTSPLVIENELALTKTDLLVKNNSAVFLVRSLDNAIEPFLASLTSVEIIGYDNYQDDFYFIDNTAKTKFESVYSRVSYQQTIDDKQVTITPPLKPFSFGEPPADYQAQQFKQQRAQKVEQIKVDVTIGTKTISLDGDETSQNRLTRAGLGMMAAKIFALETALRASTTTSAATLKAELVAALDSPQVDIKIPWVAADNSLTELDSKAAITALTKAGQAQAAAWMK